jgi:hypothetical protein
VASPIFASLFIKKYVIQWRDSPAGPWPEQEAYRRLDEARQALKRLLRQKSGAEGRILNRLTGQPLP